MDVCGVAVANDQTSADTLASWHDAGIRGLRFNLYALGGKTVYRNGVGLSSLEALAPLLRELGMHAQIWVHAPDLVELGPRFRKLGIPLVVDHMGRMNTALGTDNPGIQALCALLADGIAWTKISGADRNSREKPEYRDTDAFATRLIDELQRLLDLCVPDRLERFADVGGERRLDETGLHDV